MEKNLDQLIKSAAIILKHYGARNVYLFGSIVKNTTHKDSDIDMAVEGLPPEVFFKAMGEVHSILGRPLDLIDLDEQNPFTRYIKQEGELVHVG
ncbi:MAG: nucleotidyltransferase domain-containing protein [Candidatus Desantisbacteria bacterium]